MPLLLRWPAAGLNTEAIFNQMAHFTDWYPTLLAMAGIDASPLLGDRKIDGFNLLPTIMGESDDACTRRFWQWNRYTPLIECNAAMRDGDWKLVRPQIKEAMAVPNIEWLNVSMYNYEYFVNQGIFPDYPSREVPAPPAPELYNIADDPLEVNNLASTHPEITSKMLSTLETWFEDVETDRLTILRVAS